MLFEYYIMFKIKYLLLWEWLKQFIYGLSKQHLKNKLLKSTGTNFQWYRVAGG